MNKRICPIQERERILMSMHKPLLHTPLPNRKQKTEHPILLCLQHRYPMSLRNIPDVRLAKHPLRCNARHAVECVIDDPIEHLYQKRKFLQDPTVYVVLESACIRCMNGHAATLPRLGEVLGRRNGILRIIFVLRIVWYEFVGRARRVGV